MSTIKKSDEQVPSEKPANIEEETKETQNSNKVEFQPFTDNFSDIYEILSDKQDLIVETTELILTQLEESEQVRKEMKNDLEKCEQEKLNLIEMNFNNAREDILHNQLMKEKEIEYKIAKEKRKFAERQNNQFLPKFEPGIVIQIEKHSANVEKRLQEERKKAEKPCTIL
jgi:hypothetical protein